jgi:hypothetical protein
MDLERRIRIVRVRKILLRPEAMRVRSKQIIPPQSGGVMTIKKNAINANGNIIFIQVFKKVYGKKISRAIEKII